MILACFSGLLLCLSFPNIFYKEIFLGSNILAWVSLTPLLLSLQKVEPRQAFKRGYAAGFVFFFLSLYWICFIKPMGLGVWPAWLALAGYLALYPAVFSFAVAHGLKRGWSFEALWIPALWTLLEYAREILLTGYPWVSLGSSQALNAWLLPLVSVTGIYGLHFAVALGNVLLWQALRRSPWARREKLAGLAAIVLILGLRLAAQPRAETAQALKVKVAVLQSNIDQDRPWDAAYRKESMEVYVTMMKQAMEKGARVLIWPESAFPGIFNEMAPEAVFLIRFAKEHGVSLILGSTLRNPDTGAYTNSAVLIDPSGKVSVYAKRHLVPFGEFIPLRKWIPFLDGMLKQAGLADFEAGKENVRFEVEHIKFAPLICYESVYGSLARETPEGAIALITLDTWFGDSAAPRVHLEQAVFRAVEGGRWVARSAATGISAFVNPQGCILGQLSLNTRGWSLQEIDCVGGGTFYERFGAWFIWICVGIWLFVVWFRQKVI